MMRDITEAVSEIPVVGWLTVTFVCFIILLGAAEGWTYMTNYPSWVLDFIALILAIAAVSTFFKVLVSITRFLRAEIKERNRIHLDSKIEHEIKKMTDRQILTLKNIIQQNKLFFTVEDENHDLEAIASLGIIIKSKDTEEIKMQKDNDKSEKKPKKAKYYLNKEFIREDFLRSKTGRPNQKRGN